MDPIPPEPPESPRLSTTASWAGVVFLASLAAFLPVEAARLHLAHTLQMLSDPAGLVTDMTDDREVVAAGLVTAAIALLQLLPWRKISLVVAIVWMGWLCLGLAIATLSGSGGESNKAFNSHLPSMMQTHYVADPATPMRVGKPPHPGVGVFDLRGAATLLGLALLGATVKWSRARPPRIPKLHVRLTWMCAALVIIATVFSVKAIWITSDVGSYFRPPATPAGLTHTKPEVVTL